MKSQPNGTAWEGTPGLVPQLAPALLTPAVSLPPASPWHTPDLADVRAPVGRRLPTSRWNTNTIPNFLSRKHGCARVPASVTPAEVATGQKRGQLGRPRPTADSTSSGAGRSGRAHHSSPVHPDPRPRARVRGLWTVQTLPARGHRFRWPQRLFLTSNQVPENKRLPTQTKGLLCPPKVFVNSSWKSTQDPRLT